MELYIRRNGWPEVEVGKIPDEDGDPMIVITITNLSAINTEEPDTAKAYFDIDKLAICLPKYMATELGKEIP